MEQEIMHCWSVTDDLSALAEIVNEDPSDTKRIINVIIGLKDLYEYKFNRLFEAYENSFYK